MKFIELSDYDNDTTVIVNPAHIQAIEYHKAHGGQPGSKVQLMGASVIVKERVGTIMGKLPL